MKSIAIFASGSGTNAENVVKHFKGSKTAKVQLVVTENPQAFVLNRMQRLGIPTLVFSMNDLYSGVLLNVLKAKSIDFIVLAGFLKLIPKHIIEGFPNRIVNIHPALLPKFGGKGMYGNKVHKAVIEAGEAESGITIHMVNTDYDKGDVVFQAKCPVIHCDKPETLAERIHALEYEHYPVVIERIISKL